LLAATERALASSALAAANFAFCSSLLSFICSPSWDVGRILRRFPEHRTLPWMKRTVQLAIIERPEAPEGAGESSCFVY
jgi:hypothetical protein